MDAYQAVYDATRSKLGNCDVGDAVRRVAWEAFDISHMKAILQDEFVRAATEAQRPSAVYRPRLLLDGTAWCALYGDDLMDGVAGFGDTPAEAMAAFDKAWVTERTPAAQRSASEATGNGLPLPAPDVGAGDETNK